MALVQANCPHCGAVCQFDNTAVAVKCYKCPGAFKSISVKQTLVVGMAAVRCPSCGSPHVIMQSKVSAAGWVVFVLLLLVLCLPLFWIGLLIREPYKECTDCHARFP